MIILENKNKYRYYCLVSYFSDNGVYLAVGTLSGTVAGYVSFSLQVSNKTLLEHSFTWSNIPK